MKLLLDTHALLWWLNDDPQLGNQARTLIADPGNDIMVSIVSLWEITVKLRIGKLQANIDEISTAIEQNGFSSLPIIPAHLKILAGLPTHHRDPFDHLLIAQAIAEDAALLSADLNLQKYPAHIVACGS